MAEEKQDEKENEMSEGEFGFGGAINESFETKRYDIYLNKPICVQDNGNQAYGVLLRYDSKGRFIELCPSLVMSPEGFIYLNSETPTQFPFPEIVRPLEEGDLEAVIQKSTKQRWLDEPLDALKKMRELNL